MAGSQDKAAVISTLRACILSTKGGVPLYALNRDYKSLVGSNIPYRELNYRSLEDFISDASDIYLSKGTKGESTVHVEPTESSAHIANLISKQKSSQKKRVPVPNFSSGSRRQSNSSWRIPQKWQSHSEPSRHSQNLSVRVSQQNTSRQVTIEPKPLLNMGDKSGRFKYELPPRFEKFKENLETGPRYQKLAEDDLRWKLKECKLTKEYGDSNLDSYDDLTSKVNSKSKSSIISPFTPKNAIAAGRAQDLGDILYQYEIGVPTRREVLHSAYETSYVERLENFSRNKNWPDPIYKTLPRQPKGQKVVYGSQVKIGNDQKFFSYPDESFDRFEANEMAAKKAYLKLIELDETNFTNKVVTTNNELINERVAMIIADSPHGIWSEEVYSIYHKRYNEMLPTEWKSIVATCNTISVTEVCEGKIIIVPNPDKTTDLEKTLQTSGGGDYVNGYISPEFVQAEMEADDIVMAKQILPPDEHWDVFVTSLVTSNGIYVRLIGEEYSDKFDALLNEAEPFYSSDEKRLCPKEQIETECYYMGKVENDYCRVVIDEIDDNQIYCQLIDNGDMAVLDSSDIYILEKDYCSLPPQAILCSLTGIEEVDDVELKINIENLIVSKSLVAKVDERDDENCRYSLTLFNTSNNDLNLNDEISKMIDSFNRPPELPIKGGVKEVFVSHIDENGGLYVQIQSRRFEQLESLMSGLEQEVILENRIKSAAYMYPDKRYLAKFNSDGNYYRAVITSVPEPNDKKIKVMFIDYGNDEMVNIEDISNLEKISPSLYKIQPQAILVTLHNLQIKKRQCERLKDLITFTDPVILKIIEEGTIPQVEVFKRCIQSDGTSLLMSINNTIAVERDNRTLLRRQSFRRSQDNKKEQPTSPHSPSPELPMPSLIQGISTVNKTLASPPLPEVNKAWFDIYVTMAASPGNFIVRPLRTLKALGLMTSEMKKYFENNRTQDEKVKFENLVEGGLYAAYNGNEICRVTVSTAMDENTISVHLCDCGDFLIVPIEKLRYLPVQFTELPYQAIRAKLHGVRPKFADWTAEDCVRFQELVVDKSLVSIIKEKGPDVINASDTVLGLILIDVSSASDFVIHKELIKEMRALSCDSN